MTSSPASRRARATICTPRSWPSSPTLAISTRMGAAMAANCTVLPSAHPMATDPNFFRDLAWVIVAAVAGGALAWLARQPLILGYVVGGILVGCFTHGPTVSDTHPFDLFAGIRVVAMTVLLPALGAGVTERPLAVAIAFGKAALVLVPALFLAARVVPALMRRVARTHNDELFLLVVLGVGLGTGALTQAVGLSVALGAFLAGLIISTSD